MSSSTILVLIAACVVGFCIIGYVYSKKTIRDIDFIIDRWLNGDYN